MTQVIVTTPQELKNVFLDVLREHSRELTHKAIDAEKTTQRQKKYYTRSETAKELGITLPTLDKYAKKGIIRSHRIGNRVLYKLEDLENAIINRK